MGDIEGRIDLTQNMVQDEKLAAEAMSPGMQAVLNTSGQYAMRDAANITQAVAVVLTAPERGKGIADAYVVGETVRVCYPKPGDLVNVRLGLSQVITVGEELEYANDGLVVTRALGIRAYVAEEAVTTDGVTTQLIKVRMAAQQIV